MQANNNNKKTYFSCCKDLKINILYLSPADMAELVDALVSGTSGSNALEVRVFLSAPYFAKGFVWQVIYIWGCSSVDRALRSHRRGRGFESHQLHQIYLSAWPIRKFECLGIASAQMDEETQTTKPLNAAVMRHY